MQNSIRIVVTPITNSNCSCQPNGRNRNTIESARVANEGTTTSAIVFVTRFLRLIVGSTGPRKSASTARAGIFISNRKLHMSDTIIVHRNSIDIRFYVPCIIFIESSPSRWIFSSVSNICNLCQGIEVALGFMI